MSKVVKIFHRQTDQQTDRQTDIATYRAAIAAKNNLQLIISMHTRNKTPDI